MQKLSSVQNTTCIITVADTKINYSLYICNVVFHPSLQFKLNRFFSLVLFSTAIDKRKKLTGKLSKCKLGGSSNLLFLLLNTFKTIFSYRFCQKSGNDVNSKGRRGGGSNSLRHIKANRYGNRCIH